MRRIVSSAGPVSASILMFSMLLLIAAGALAAGRSGPVVLMLNKSDDTVTFVDPKSLEILGKAPTGVGPHEVAVDAAGEFAYIANYGRQTPGGDLSIIDVRARKAAGRIDLGKKCRPHGLAFGPGDRELWVTCEVDQVVMVVDVKNRKVLRTYPTGQDVTHMIVLTPDGRQAFTANMGSNTVTVIDSRTGKVSQIQVGDGPEGIDITPNGKEVWVSHRNGGDLSIISTETHEILQTIQVGNFPIRVKITPDGQRALVSNMRGGDVAVFDTSTRKLVKRIALEEAPIGVLITPDGKTGFVANTAANAVTVLDLKTLKVAGTVKPGKEPDGLGWAAGI